MRTAFAALALAAVVAASPMPQASDVPAGCSSSYSGTFEISVVNVTTASKRDLSKRAAVVCTLENGRLSDELNRTGEIVANHQFQFDNLTQAGALYTSGWSVCSNGSLAVGGSAIFYQCLSGDFYNLYNSDIGDQCSPIYIDVVQSSGSASAISDGQVTASDVSSAAAVTQISDGQVQASTAASAITQISDGQIQAPTSTAAPITQISDGQIQAPTSTAAPITQISDGQIQAPTTTVAPITQISDGQIQAPTSTTVTPITQISDGQIQAPATGTGYYNATSATASPSPYTGAAGAVEASFGLGLGAAVLALLL